MLTAPFLSKISPGRHGLRLFGSLMGGFAFAQLATLRAQSTYPTPYTISTFAGSPTLTGSANGAGGIARFYYPISLATDSAGNVYVADQQNCLIRKITPAGVVSTLAGSPGLAGTTDGGGGGARFTSPDGIAVDGRGMIYVADGRIRTITPAGVVSTITSTIGSYCTGVAVDAAGTIYATERSQQRILKITPAGALSVFAGLLNVSGYVDASTGAAARFNLPNGLAVDKAGNVYVADSFNHAIRKITPAGVVSTLAGGPAPTPVFGSADGTGSAARFYEPVQLAADAAGNIFVADRSNRTVRKITPTGVVTTLAGLTGVAAGTVNGVGSAARFNDPYGMAVDDAGNFFMTDYVNHVIRVGAPPGAGTVAGIAIPLLIPVGASAVDARALAESPTGSVLVGISGKYAVKPSSGGAQALVTPNYTNPQPYNLSYVVRLLANGQPDPAFTSAPGGDGTVNTVAVQADGKILVGGTFASFNTVFFKNLARLQADGKADGTFLIGSGPDAQVNALAVQADGKILVGGAFQNFGGQSRPYLLRLGATGAVDTAFAPALNGAVDAIVVQPDGKILVGGTFTSAGGAARSRIARLLATGANDSTFDPGAGANDEVVALRLQANGAIIAAGDFTSFAGQARSRLVRVLATGALDSTFSPAASADKTVISLGLEASGNVVLGGAFTQVNGVARNRLARLLVDGALDPSFDPGDGANNDVRSVLPRADGTIFLGGLFDQYQGAPANAVVAIASTPVATAFLRAPQPLTVNLGSTVRFVTSATGVGTLTYQWSKDGVAIGGATGATLTMSGASASTQGRYALQVTSASGSVTAGDALLTVTNTNDFGRLINLSVLTGLGSGEGLFTVGTVIGGAGTTGPKPLLIRAAGPSLTPLGVVGVLPDPKLDLFSGPAVVGTNDNWGGTAALSAAFTSVGAFPYVNAVSKDAAVYNPSLPAGGYTVQVSGAAGSSGNVIAELYDATPSAGFTPATPRLINVSVLKQIDAGALLTVGFVIGGSTAKTVLVRVIGPALTGFGVVGAMADPKLDLFSGSTVIASNDNWAGDPQIAAAAGAVGAFALTNAASKDAIMFITLAPGGYTVQASGVSSTAGAALVEVYEVP